MFGYFKPDKECPQNIKNNYKLYYCFLCKAIGKHYSIIARLLLSYDVTLLLILFSDDDFLYGIKQIKCVKKDAGLNELLNSEPAKNISALNLLLAAAKLEDDICDENFLKSRAVKSVFSRQFEKAKKNSPIIWSIIRDEYNKLRTLEKNNADLETLEKQFSYMMRRIGKEIFYLKNEKLEKYLDIAAKWLYFIDAVDDIDENIKYSTFNPLTAYGSFSKLKNTGYNYLSRHFQNLYKGITPLNGGINSELLNRVMFCSIPKKTVYILLRGNR